MGIRFFFELYQILNLLALHVLRALVVFTAVDDSVDDTNHTRPHVFFTAINPRALVEEVM